MGKEGRKEGQGGIVICAYCKMDSGTKGDHVFQADCIKAMQAEIRRLSEALAKYGKKIFAKARKQARKVDSARSFKLAAIKNPR